MELKCNDAAEKIFFIFLEFSSKSMIKLNVTFGRSQYEIIILLRKPRFTDEIITLMRDKFV